MAIRVPTTPVSGRMRPTQTFPTVTSMYLDAAVSGTTDQEQTLLRFDNIVGSDANQIPPGARVEGAVLDLAAVVGNAPGAGGNFHALLQPWQDTTSTWNSWGNGIQTDNVEAAVTPTVTLGNATLTPKVQGGFHSLDVTSDIQAWVSGTRTNYGWVGLPWPGGTDGWGFATAESTLQRNRPQLCVYYTPVSSMPITLLPPVSLPTGVELRFAGPVGAVCTIQRATGLGGAWSALGTVTVGPDGLAIFNDSSFPATAAFYRLTYP